MKGGKVMTRNMRLGRKFCDCIKKVRRTVKLRKRYGTKKAREAAKESAAIGICVNSVLKTRRKTLKRFTCGKKPLLKTQSLKN
jgi:hypothetical protein